MSATLTYSHVMMQLFFSFFEDHARMSEKLYMHICMLLLHLIVAFKLLILTIEVPFFLILPLRNCRNIITMDQSSVNQIFLTLKIKDYIN